MRHVTLCHVAGLREMLAAENLKLWLKAVAIGTQSQHQAPGLPAMCPMPTLGSGMPRYIQQDGSIGYCECGVALIGSVWVVIRIQGSGLVFQYACVAHH